MPNHVTNRVIVRGPVESIKDFKNGCFDEWKSNDPEEKRPNIVFDFNKIAPMPAFINQGSFTFGDHYDKTGRNWYNWSIENWGTKWNSYDNVMIVDDPECLIFVFDTAWSTPLPILETLGRYFKELYISIEYFDEGYNFWGEDIKPAGQTQFDQKVYDSRVKTEEAKYFFYKLRHQLKGYDCDEEEEGHKVKQRKPSFACDLDTSKMNYPVMGFPKIDGVRILNLTGNATARSLMPHANKFTTERFSKQIYFGIDGEGTMGDERSESLCRDTTSALNTIEGEPDIVWHAFDFLRPDIIDFTYLDRYRALEQYVRRHKPPGVKVIPYELIKNEAQLISFYHRCLEAGYEGAVYRDPMGLHKDGRCTASEANYVRLKPSSDKEARVLEIVEAVKNNNPPKINALGLTERSSHKANLVGKGMVGRLVCEDLETGQRINIMPGKMKHKERVHFFNHPEEIVGKLIKYRSTDTGVKDAPRFGRYICIRSEEDTVVDTDNCTYFDFDNTGKLLGYHCEGGETFEYGGSVPLTMETLDDGRLLFMGNNVDEWVPHHLNLGDYKLYKITFDKPPKTKVFRDFNEYHELFSWNDKTNRYDIQPKLQALIDTGYRLFVLDRNTQDELTESFLINPKQYVRSIEEIPFTKPTGTEMIENILSDISPLWAGKVTSCKFSSPAQI